MDEVRLFFPLLPLILFCIHSKICKGRHDHDWCMV